MLHPGLLRYAETHLDAMTAEDMVSETLLTIFRKDLPAPGTDAEMRRLRALGYRILAGLISNEYRSRRRRASLTDKLIQHGEFPTTVQSHENDIALRTDVAAALSALTDADREVVLLVQAGLTVEEMATILGCSAQAARKRRTRARARLRQVLLQMKGGSHD